MLVSSVVLGSHGNISCRHVYNKMELLRLCDMHRRFFCDEGVLTNVKFVTVELIFC